MSSPGAASTPARVIQPSPRTTTRFSSSVRSRNCASTRLGNSTSMFRRGSAVEGGEIVITYLGRRQRTGPDRCEFAGEAPHYTSQHESLASRQLGERANDRTLDPNVL